MTLPAQILRTITARYPAVVPHLSPAARAMLKAADALAGINAAYHDAITRALITYFEGSGSITAPRNAFRQAMITAFNGAFDAGWVDGGAELPLDDEATAWIESRIAEEAGHIDAAFQDAKEIRKDTGADYFAWATARADGYTGAVASVYNAAKMLAAGKKMLTWHLGQTEQHCSTCASLNGKKHPAYWYIKRNYIPRKPGAAMDCGGYNCDCSLTDKNGEEVTI